MNKKKKIMHVLHAVGGVDVYLRLLLKHIDPNEFEIIVVHGKSDTGSKYFDKNNLQIKEYLLPIQREINLLKDTKSILELSKIIKKENPDIIHAHSAKGGIIARSVAWFLNINILYTPHAFSYLSTDSLIKRNLFKLIEKLFKYSGNFILATSPSETKRAIEELNYKSPKVLLYNNSVENIQLSENQNSEFNLPKEYICSIGRPSYQKNIEAMVRVFSQVKAKIPEMNFVLMGVGFHSPNEQKVRELIEHLGLKESFILLPWVSRDEIFPIIKNSKLYISTSRYEGLPYSIIESLALGKACVVSDCDGNRDLVKEEYNGKIYAQNEVEQKMANGIIELLKDNQKRENFEKNALKLFQENYDIEKTIIQVEKIYTSLSKR